MKDTEITVTCREPGATDTDFFARADELDTKVGQQKKDDPADVAKTGFKAMMKGERYVVHGWKNKAQVAMAGVAPKGMLAEQHRKMAEPGTAIRSGSPKNPSYMPLTPESFNDFDWLAILHSTSYHRGGLPR